MGGLEIDLVELLYKMLPGLVAAAVFHSVTPYPRRDVFDRIVNALVFTAFGQIVVGVIRPILLLFGDYIFSIGSWTDETSLIVATIGACASSILLGYLLNTDKLHKFLRDCYITKRVSLPSQWYSAFMRYERYIVLVLKDGNRLYGWPKEWPDADDRGHFIMSETAWLLDDGSKAEIHDVEIMLIASADVESVEFLRFSDDPVVTSNRDEIERSRSILINLNQKE